MDSGSGAAESIGEEGGEAAILNVGGGREKREEKGGRRGRGGGGHNMQKRKAGEVLFLRILSSCGSMHRMRMSYGSHQE